MTDYNLAELVAPTDYGSVRLTPDPIPISEGSDPSDLAPERLTPDPIPITEGSLSFGVGGGGGGGSPATYVTYYKRGFYATSGLFEYWQSNDPGSTNPSGNPLTNITITATSSVST